jgi:ABC-type branched-subunit amino acid transport system ATPase component
MSVAGPPQDANSAPRGAAQRRKPQAWGDRTTVSTSVPLLALDRLAVSYGGIQAVKGIDVVVGEGELVCLIGAMTIEENLVMGAYARSDRAAIRQDIERVYTLFARLKERRRQTAGTLSGGEQQMLAIARAIMSRPRLLLLDEPSMGLAPLMVQKVFETILQVAKEGVTMLLVEQNAKLALDVSDRGYVMESGEVTLAGKAADLLHDPKVRAAYLGEAD